MGQEIIPIKVGFVKAFLIKGKKSILVDAGYPKAYDTFVKSFKKNNINPEDISLIIVTHNHTDHVGELVKLQEMTEAKVVIHKNEAENLKNGISTSVKHRSLLPRILFALIKKPKPVVFEPHIVVEDTMNLTEYGVDGKMIHTPGHTNGSMSILLENGDAIVGDMIMGKKKGQSSKAKFPFIANDVEEIKISLRKLIQEGAKYFYNAHGDICDVEAVKKLIGS